MSNEGLSTTDSHDMRRNSTSQMVENENCRRSRLAACCIMPQYENDGSVRQASERLNGGFEEQRRRDRMRRLLSMWVELCKDLWTKEQESLWGHHMC